MELYERSCNVEYLGLSNHAMLAAAHHGLLSVDNTNDSITICRALEGWIKHQVQRMLVLIFTRTKHQQASMDALFHASTRSISPVPVLRHSRFQKMT